MSNVTDKTDTAPRNSLNRKTSSGQKKVSAVFKSAEEATKPAADTVDIAIGLNQKYGDYGGEPGWRKLFRKMRQLEMGNKVDIRTKWFEGKPRQWISRQMKSLFGIGTQSAFSKVSSDLGARQFLAEHEENNLDKMGPIGMFTPQSSWAPSKLANYYDFDAKGKYPKDLNRSAWDEACQRLAGAVPAKSINALSIDEVKPDSQMGDDKHLDGSTYSGFPGCTSDWYIPMGSPKRAKEDDWHRHVRESITNDTREWRARCEETLDWTKCVRDLVYVCQQRVNVARGPNPLKPNNQGDIKAIRPIWAGDKRHVWLSKTVGAPIQLVMKGLTWKDTGLTSYPGWWNVTDRDVIMQRAMAINPKAKYLAGDWSSFDQHVNPWMRWDMCLAISNWLSEPARTIYLAVQYSSIFKSRILFSGGVMGPGPSGIHSGDYTTSVDGSGYNTLLHFYGEEAGLYLLDYAAFMGDDFWGHGDGFTPEAEAEMAKQTGMALKAEQQVHLTSVVEFLQFSHVLGTPGGIYPISRCAVKSTSQETEAKMLKSDYGNPYFGYFQWLARMNNGMYHPQAEEFWRWAVRGIPHWQQLTKLDPDRLLSLAGDSAKMRLTQQSYSPGTDLSRAGLAFRDFPICRVLQLGESMPPAGGVDRWEWVNRTRFEGYNLNAS